MSFLHSQFQSLSHLSLICLSTTHLKNKNKKSQFNPLLPLAAILGLSVSQTFLKKQLSVFANVTSSSPVQFCSHFRVICRSISPPTVFTKVTNYPILRSQKGHFQFSSYLNLSTAFNTVNHCDIFPLCPPWQKSPYFLVTVLATLFQFYSTIIFYPAIRYYILKFFGAQSSFSSIYLHPTTFIISSLSLKCRWFLRYSPAHTSLSYKPIYPTAYLTPLMSQRYLKHKRSKLN